MAMLMSGQVQYGKTLSLTAKSGKILGHHEGWVYEEKVDGWRMVAYKDGAAVRLMSPIMNLADCAWWSDILSPDRLSSSRACQQDDLATRSPSCSSPAGSRWRSPTRRCPGVGSEAQRAVCPMRGSAGPTSRPGFGPSRFAAKAGHAA